MIMGMDDYCKINKLQLNQLKTRVFHLRNNEAERKKVEN